MKIVGEAIHIIESLSSQDVLDGRTEGKALSSAQKTLSIGQIASWRLLPAITSYCTKIVMLRKLFR